MARIDDLINIVSFRVSEFLETVSQQEVSEVPVDDPDIENELDEASTWLLRRIPRHLCYFVVKQPDSGPTITTDSVADQALIPLPLDYLRFYSVKMDGWETKVTGYMRDDTQQYRNQQFRHLRGTVENPVAFLVPNPSSPANADLEVYPDGDGTLDTLLYVPDLAATDMPTDFDDALTWKAAASVLQSLRRNGLAAEALEQMQVALGQIKTGLAGEEVQSQPLPGA